jgi:hypothetical protein
MSGKVLIRSLLGVRRCKSEGEWNVTYGGTDDYYTYEEGDDIDEE